MKKLMMGALLAVLGFGLAACGRLNTPEKRQGYAVGLSFGNNMAPIKDKIDFSQVKKGLAAKAKGDTTTMSDDEMQKTLQALQQGQVADKAKTGFAVGLSVGQNLKYVMAYIDLGMVIKGMKDQIDGKPKLDSAAMQEAFLGINKSWSEKNKPEGEQFLNKNKALPGVQVTASGLQYQVLKPGSGPKPKATTTVKVDYIGTLPDGTKFDASADHGGTATFALNQVIPGWTEGLQLMPVGSRYRFVIPANLAYADHGQGPFIGPDRVLVFEVGLISIEKAVKK